MADLKGWFNKSFIEVVYGNLKVEVEANKLDSIYEDYIIHEVGTLGLIVLKEYNLLESCGVINGRQLYVLCDRK